jgi:ABC-type lipoprotein export system ATPase subunit
MGLKLMNINKSFGLGIGTPRKKILDSVSMEIRDGEMVAIVGKRGSGKTTLMNIMTGLNRPDSGKYIIDGKLIGLGRTFLMANFRAKKCGIITKKSLLVPEMTIFDNITMPLNHRLFMTRKKKLKRAREVLRGLGLKGKGRFYPIEFSTLDRQKICAGRAMIAEPKYIFADEPTAGLTANDVDRYMDFLEVLNSAGYTIIVFTYSKRVASHCHRMIPVSGEDLPEEEVGSYGDDFAEKPAKRREDEKPSKKREEEPEPEEEEETVIDEPSEEEAEPVSPEVHEILGEDITEDKNEEPIEEIHDVEEEPAKPVRPRTPRTRKPAKKKAPQENKITTDEDE